MLDRAVLVHRRQQVEQRVVQFGAALAGASKLYCRWTPRWVTSGKGRVATDPSVHCCPAAGADDPREGGGEGGRTRHAGLSSQHERSHHRHRLLVRLLLALLVHRQRMGRCAGRAPRPAGAPPRHPAGRHLPGGRAEEPGVLPAQARILDRDFARSARFEGLPYRVPAAVSDPHAERGAGVLVAARHAGRRGRCRIGRAPACAPVHARRARCTIRRR